MTRPSSSRPWRQAGGAPRRIRSSARRVLDDDRAGGRRPGEDADAAGERHRRARRDVDGRRRRPRPRPRPAGRRAGGRSRRSRPGRASAPDSADRPGDDRVARILDDHPSVGAQPQPRRDAPIPMIAPDRIDDLARARSRPRASLAGGRRSRPGGGDRRLDPPSPRCRPTRRASATPRGAGARSPSRRSAPVRPADRSPSRRRRRSKRGTGSRGGGRGRASRWRRRPQARQADRIASARPRPMSRVDRRPPRRRVGSGRGGCGATIVPKPIRPTR